MPPATIIIRGGGDLNQREDDCSDVTDPTFGINQSQQDELHTLSSKLRQYEDEIKNLKTEKSVLLDELAGVVVSEGHQDANRRYSTLPNQPDTNAKLFRLQVVVNVMRKSFKKHIEEIRRRNDDEKRCFQRMLKMAAAEREHDKRAIESLRQENELMRQQMLRSSTLETAVSRGSSVTPLDALDWSLPGQQDMRFVGDSHHSCPYRDIGLKSFGSKGYAEPNKKSSACIRYADEAASKESEELIVDFGQTSLGLKIERRCHSSRAA